MAGNISEVTDQNFEEEILKSDKPALVDFWAPWCGPCRAIAPTVEDLSKKYAGKMKFAKLNVEENQSTSSKYSIMSIPALLIFKNGKVFEQLIGAAPKSELESFILRALK